MASTLNYAGQSISLTDPEAAEVLDAMAAATGNRGRQGTVLTVGTTTVLISPGVPISVTTS